MAKKIRKLEDYLLSKKSKNDLKAAKIAMMEIALLAQTLLHHL